MLPEFEINDCVRIHFKHIYYKTKIVIFEPVV